MIITPNDIHFNNENPPELLNLNNEYGLALKIYNLYNNE